MEDLQGYDCSIEIAEVLLNNDFDMAENLIMAEAPQEDEEMANMLGY